MPGDGAEKLPAGKFSGDQGVFGEPAGAAGFAGLIKAVTRGLIKGWERTATIVTGNGLKDIQNALKAAGEPFRIEADFRELEKIFAAP